MPEQQVIDEVVADRTPAARTNTLAARPTVSESVGAAGTAKSVRAGVEEDAVPEGARHGRVLKESTQKLLEKLSAAPADEGDPDEGEETGDVEAEDPDDVGLVEGEAPAEGEVQEEVEAKPEADDEIRTTAARLEQRNRELIAELEAARKTPRAARTPREDALIAAEAAYFDEGTVPALRKFLSVITGAAPDSKEVEAELTGLYVDLTEKEVGVPLDQNQKALRDNARTRLLLARDKREKAEGTKTDAGNGADAVQYDGAAKYVDNVLSTKGQSGTSLADEYPMLALAEDFDGYAPSEVIARAVHQEYLAGTLDPNGNPEDHVRSVARKVNDHYDRLAKKIETIRTKTKKPDTATAPSTKPKAASSTSTEQRQSPAARTITNAAASRAPANPPKAPTERKAATTTQKTRKDFPNEQAWRQHLLNKHFSS